MTTNSPIECEFFDSIQCGRYEDVRRVVENAQELLHAFDYRCFGATPITSIAFRGSDSHDLDMIQLLIDLGADVNRRSDWWAGPWSPLHCAICLGNDELAEFLLRNGATIDLHTAAALGKLDELSRLLDADPARQISTPDASIITVLPSSICQTCARSLLGICFQKVLSVIFSQQCWLATLTW